ncbi:uncharacterized protein TRUGW13939_01421 [Talaromyces rugulosus]|uniref:Trichothecene 3-O-acetyltransferase-like N-terminal domain-containing protein n=1 Tax=Talaromyces rugulosus TaxID=121627 RepID=A0A7H8QLE3_TALRU|nr:uncharacterized protein TRUGW13939_01421 [Talaromyces rugulosus]QKX54335.1 hypothetical protein TRUGW13939_01421 [Talaromyces rugulosus]
METLQKCSQKSDCFPLDILGQQPRINRLYTQITLCFALPGSGPVTEQKTINILRKGIRVLSSTFPWTAGRVIKENDCFQIRPLESCPDIVVKDCKHDVSLPDWDTLQKAQFPFSMLKESDIAPYNTLVSSAITDLDLPVFIVQANFISGGLLLTINGQHGSMDMAGQGQVMQLLTKASRGEQFTAAEVRIGNMSRRSVIPLLDFYTPEPVSEPQVVDNNSQNQPIQKEDKESPIVWAYFVFSSTSLACLKSSATETVPGNGFVSTDDVLSVFVWKAMTRARLPRFTAPNVLKSTLFRNVDVRHHLSIPSSYPGLVTNATIHTYAMNAVMDEPLGILANDLRSALDLESLKYKTRILATQISTAENAQKPSFVSGSVPELDVRLSSWAKEKFYDLDFGFGKPTAVRRPQFIVGAREGLVYFLPKKPDGEIVIGICLREDDMERLKDDKGFANFGLYIG